MHDTVKQTLGQWIPIRGSSLRVQAFHHFSFTFSKRWYPRARQQACKLGYVASHEIITRSPILRNPNTIVTVHISPTQL